MAIAADLIKTLNLQPHPEGGFYRETFRSELSVETQGGPRSAGTAILYLLEGHDVSRFHRIDADELWFFHKGGPLLIHTLKDDATVQTQHLSSENPQAKVMAGEWFGAELADSGDYCLVSCTVMPGFEFAGFELACKDTLLARWPLHADLIHRLT